MPMPTRHRKLFYSTQSWQDLQRHVRNSAQDQGAVYVEASDWVTADDYFEDATHLSADGARFFSARLASHFATSLVSSNTFAKPASVPALAGGGIKH